MATLLIYCTSRSDVIIIFGSSFGFTSLQEGEERGKGGEALVLLDVVSLD